MGKLHLSGRAFFWLLCFSVTVCLLLVHCFSPNFTCLVSWVGWAPTGPWLQMPPWSHQCSILHLITATKLKWTQCHLPVPSCPLVHMDAWASRCSKWYPLLFLPSSCIWSIVYSDWLISLKVAQIHLCLSTHMSPPSSKLSTPWIIVAAALCQVGFFQTENPMEPFSFPTERPKRRPPPTL